MARPDVEGTVTEWDDARGVGTVTTDDGRALDLQCTHLADGTRTTSVGTRVVVAVAPGHHGRWQAVGVSAPPR